MTKAGSDLNVESDMKLEQLESFLGKLNKGQPLLDYVIIIIMLFPDRKMTM